MNPTIAPADHPVFTRLVDDVHACRVCHAMTHCHTLSGANGPLDARALFVAEAPGRRGAAVTGVPLTRDETGRRFEAFLGLAGVQRSDVFITNAVLCNPIDGRGRNRPPSPRERDACLTHLARTVEVVQAPVIVALGRVALDALHQLTPHDARLANDSGRPLPWGARVLVPLYHPSRQSTLHRDQARQESDWRALGAILAATRASGTPTRLLP